VKPGNKGNGRAGLSINRYGANEWMNEEKGNKTNERKKEGDIERRHEWVGVESDSQNFVFGHKTPVVVL
jgi:hypothetical protein